ncbi:MAG: hypothetical protein ACTSSH_04970 [Candidatus Heimdallarchaeota archaeon]
MSIITDPKIIMNVILDYIQYVGKGKLNYKELFDHRRLTREGILKGLQLLLDKDMIEISTSIAEIKKGGSAVLTLKEGGKQQVHKTNEKLKAKQAERDKSLKPIDWERRIVAIIPILKIKNNLTIGNLVGYTRLDREKVVRALNSLMEKNMLAPKLILANLSDDVIIHINLTAAGTKWLQKNIRSHK